MHNLLIFFLYFQDLNIRFRKLVNFIIRILFHEPFIVLVNTQVKMHFLIPTDIYFYQIIRNTLPVILNCVLRKQIILINLTNYHIIKQVNAFIKCYCIKLCIKLIIDTPWVSNYQLIIFQVNIVQRIRMPLSPKFSVVFIKLPRDHRNQKPFTKFFFYQFKQFLLFSWIFSIFTHYHMPLNRTPRNTPQPILSIASPKI